MKIFVFEVSNYANSYHSDALIAVCKMLKRKRVEVLNGNDTEMFQRIIELCKESDGAIFSFWIGDNTELMGYQMQYALVAMTRMLFELKKPVLVTQNLSEWRTPRVLSKTLHQKDGSDVFAFDNSDEFLSRSELFLKEVKKSKSPTI